MTGSVAESLRIEPLRREHDRASFRCGVDALDRYLGTQATQDAKRGATAPFVAVEGSSAAIVGYYTLSMFGVELRRVPDDTAKRLPKYPMIPAVLLGRLAVGQAYRGRGIGAFLLMDAFQRALRSEIAWAMFIVSAKDDAAAGFYRKFGFIRFNDEPDRLFISRSRIAAALG